MPFRPMKPCGYRGCQVLVSAGRCQACRRQAEQLRGNATDRGYDHRHRTWRAQVLAQCPYCVDPERRHPHELRPSRVADHVVPLRRGGTWDLTNGRGLCLSCHNALGARERARHEGGGSKV